MNLEAELNQVFFEGINEVPNSTSGYVSPKYLLGSGSKTDILTGGRLAMKKLVKRKMKVYGSAGKAN